jgi:hypothetical protein
MRAAAGIVVALLAFVAFAPVPALAVAVVPGASDIGTSPNIVQVDRRCGHGRHWVPRHRHHGHLVHGHCAPNHH